MRGSCIAITFGWSWEFVSRAIVFRGGLKAGDKLVLLVSKARGDYEAMRFREALYAVERFVESLGIDFDECCRICEIDVHGKNFLDMVSEVSNCIASELRECSSLEVYLLGGMRMLILAALYSIDILRSIVSIDVAIYSGPEDGSRIIEIPHTLHRDLGYCTENQLQLLAKLLTLGEASPDQLADEGRSIDSIRKTLEKLASKGLVVKKSRGRRTLYELSKLGKTIATIYTTYTQNKNS